MSLSMGKIIKKLRKERNLTQEELAEQLNVTFQAISKWENETGMPDISQIVPLASVFGVSTDVLFGTVGTNDNEEAKKILDDAYYSFDVNSKESLKRRYNILQDGLKRYPNNVGLLVNCLETGLAVALPGNNYYDESCGHEIYQECERMANITINYPKNVNINDILRVHMIMVLLNNAYGNTDKAREHAEHFPSRSDMTRNAMEAYISHSEKNYAHEAEYSRTNTNFHLESLAYAMMQTANAYKHMQCNDYALEIYNRVKQLLELFPNDQHFSTPTVYTEWGQLNDLIAELERVEWRTLDK